MTVVLMEGPTLEFVHRQDIPDYKPPPGVIIWGTRVFAFAYQENPDTLVYRETLAITLPDAGGCGRKFRDDANRRYTCLKPKGHPGLCFPDHDLTVVSE